MITVPNPDHAAALAEHITAIRKLGKRAITDIIEIGSRLTECRKLVGHGAWLPWLDREFGWTEQTALNFMRVHELAKSKNFLDLNLPVSAIYLLAAPSTPAEARDEIIERAQAGKTVPVAETKRVIEKHKPAKKTERNRRARHRRAEKSRQKREAELQAIEAEEAKAFEKATLLAADLKKAGLAERVLTYLRWEEGNPIVLQDALTDLLRPADDGNDVDPEQAAEQRKQKFAAMETATADDGLDIPERLRCEPKAAAS